MSRKREFQAGAIFSRVHRHGLDPRITSPWTSTHEGQQDIPVKKLVATQTHIDPQRVKHYANQPENDPITVVRWGDHGKPYIYDGHHRAAAAMRRGEKTIKAEVHQVEDY